MYRISRSSFTLLAIALIAAAIFLKLAGGIRLNGGFNWDASLMLALHQYSQPWLDKFFMAVTQTASAWIALPLLIAVASFWRRGGKLEAGVLLAASGGSAIINALLKVAFARPRPAVFPPLTIETSYSFPSGHTMAATAFYGLLAIFLWREQRYGWAALVGVWPLVVGLSRIYLGVHYPSDVLGALAMGVMWLALIAAVYDKIKLVGRAG